MKTFISALAVAAALSATPAFAGYGSATAADTATPSASASDEANVPIAADEAPIDAQLQATQHGVGPTFGDDERATAPAQEGGPAVAAGQDEGVLIIAPYPNGDRPAFDGGR
jgi:hypothetical protein